MRPSPKKEWFKLQTIGHQKTKHKYLNYIMQFPMSLALATPNEGGLRENMQKAWDM
jgi:hypothetical protein